MLLRESRLCLLLATVSAISAAEDLAGRAYGILKINCFACHGAAKASGLDLRTREALLAGGERGPAVDLEEPGRSLLYKVLSHEHKPAMPPGKKLAENDIDVVRRWLEAGASLDSVEEARSPGEKAKLAELAKLEERPILPEDRQFWAFQRPSKVDPPQAGKRNPVDAFLYAALQAEGLKPSPRADRRTLIRRAYLDLLGLPPSPDEVEAFVKDNSPQAWDRQVERLLASPHYGERWGRHWLDVVRYADSGGFERDYDWPNGYRYRDYVVKAFNEDKSYDQFIREQLAGDEYAPDSQEALIATGYLRLGPVNNIRNERTRIDELDDIVVTTSVGFLGMTVGCARCHNHKFDPIPQKDYYRLQAVFFSTKEVEHPLVGPEVVEAYKAEMKRIDELQKPHKKAKEEIEEPYRKILFDRKLATLPEYMQIAWKTPPEKRTEGQRLNANQIEKTIRFKEEEILAIMPEEEKQRHKEVAGEIAGLEKQRPERYPTARIIGEGGREPLPSHFLHRGSIDVKGSVMQAGVLSVACEDEYEFPTPPENARSSWRRRGLAEWIASPSNPLTARVMVNRIWQHHFGEGIVRTPNNFGKTGQAPTHPELLDWLAVEFMERGWSIKAMHRLMMMSEAYQMASDDIAANLKIDPENRYVWRMPRRRLEAEIIRDQILAVAGTLDRTVGGPAVFPYIDPDLFQSSTDRTWKGKPDDDPSTWRRSIYVFSKRSIRYPLFETFDQPDMINSCDRRNRSTIAPQALLLMNNAFVMFQSQQFAERLRREAGENLADQVELAYRLALSRPPSRFERESAAEFIASGPRGLVDFCQALFNLNEFVYRQ
ncbi:MAG: PSD1 and planctomycete cytochrome C domain-containing protein [Bryobacteraceae bacterium]